MYIELVVLACILISGHVRGPENQVQHALIVDAIIFASVVMWFEGSPEQGRDSSSLF